ncbi:MAG TPA: hypothetical protein VHY82_02685 [Acetobacteraceae bacterium]|nr:hypothetical protein [Acetobacteraceae bacterium]
MPVMAWHDAKLKPYDLVGEARFVQQSENALRVGVVETMDDDCGYLLI